MKQVHQVLAILVILVLGLTTACNEQGEVTEQDEATAQQTNEEAPNSAETGDDHTFYALGLAISQNLGEFGLTEEELDQVKQGLEDGVMGREAKVDLEEYAPRIQALARERAQRAAETEREEGKKFLAEAAEAEAAQRTESGLIFEMVEEGTGATPTASDTVAVHYRGTLRNGTVFDSSYERGQPAQIPLDQVFPCWSEGVQRMKVGGKAKLICPPDLAYGDRQAGQIPPGSTLIFEIELLEVLE